MRCGPKEYFDEIHDVKVTKDMLDLARHIVNQKAGISGPEKFEDHYENALLSSSTRNAQGKPITAKRAPAGTTWSISWMRCAKASEEALRPSAGSDETAKKPRKASAGQKEMLLPIVGKKSVKEAVLNKPSASHIGNRPRVS